MKAAVSKIAILSNQDRGFESHPLRHGKGKLSGPHMGTHIRKESFGMKLKTFIFITLMGSLSLMALAQAENGKKSGTFSFYLENDLFAGTDRYYTSGVKLTWISPDLMGNQKNSRLLKWIHSLSKKFPFINKPGFHHAISISIGHNIYTPEDIERSDLIMEDRPYAGISYLGIGFNSQSNCRMSSLEFCLGIVGPHSYGERYQKILHKLINADYPRGWDNQLKDELVLGINYDQKWRLLRSGKERDFGYELITHMGGGLGNLYTGATAGIEVRIGKDLPNDFGSFPIHPGGDSNAIFSKEDSRLYCHSRPRIHAFAAVNVNAVVRDIFLDGNTFQDSHSVEKKSFTGDIVVGVALAVNRFKISYAYVYRTKRFKTQRKPQVFGSINISFYY